MKKCYFLFEKKLRNCKPQFGGSATKEKQSWYYPKLIFSLRHFGHFLLRRFGHRDITVMSLTVVSKVAVIVSISLLFSDILTEKT